MGPISKAGEAPSGRLDRIDRVFDAAVELPLSEQASFVALACGDDHTLRAEVLDLLRLYRADGFLDAPVARVASSVIEAATAIGGPVPERIGPFRVMHEIGLSDSIDVLAISAVEGMAKPDPEFFRSACERAGVDPGDAVMIGDSYRADVLGARATGMDSVLLDRNGTATETDVPIARTLTEAVELAVTSRRAAAR